MLNPTNCISVCLNNYQGFVTVPLVVDKLYGIVARSNISFEC